MFVAKAKQKAKFLLAKKKNSRYNFRSFNGFQPEKNPNLMFSCSSNLQKEVKNETDAT